MDAAAVPGPVRNQLRAIFQRDEQADRIGLVWKEPLAEPEARLEVGDVPVRLVWCPSELALRERLVQHMEGEERLVLLSPFDETTLGKDVLARLWRYEPRRIDPWRTLEQLLGVRQIDPRVRRHRWLAECLVDDYDRYVGELSFGPVLDRDRAWQALVLARLDYREPAVDWPSLLRWSLTPGVNRAMAALPEAVRANLSEWLQPRMADDEAVVRALWAGGHAGDMLAVGLACDVLYRDGVAADQALYQARGRFAERFLGGVAISQPALRRFGEAAEVFAQGERSVSTLGTPLTRAEQILASLDLTPLAAASDVLPMGFSQRLAQFAAALKQALGGKSVSPAIDALGSLRKHCTAGARGDTVHRAEMAVRACTWLQTPVSKDDTAAALVVDYVDNGGHLDWARSRVWQGDADEALDRVYRQLSKRLAERREAFNRRFADVLPAIARGDQLSDSLVPVERALERVIAPLAKQGPVLLVVLDGMSMAVYRELASVLETHNWVTLRPESGEGPRCLLAALPTRTAVSRYALLAGVIGEGGATDEKAAFSAHPVLKASTSTKHPPLLFHKADLAQPGSGALAAAVRERIAGPEHRVIAAVVNAIDDHLASGAQVGMRWSEATIAVLFQLLQAARESGRTVVLTSDHGHVLEQDMTYRKSGGESERFKPGTDAVEDGEISCSGPRVVASAGKVVLPWSEAIRYSPGRKVGYHGGGAPQEVIIPLGIFRFAGESDTLPGWIEVPYSEPSWWRLSVADGEQKPVPAPVAKRPKATPVPDAMPDLFAALAPTPAAVSGWIEALFQSPTYQGMRTRAGRTGITNPQLAELLRLLEAAGGQQVLGSLSQGLNIPLIRMRGFLAGAQKLLNVDGYPVLAVDHAKKTVKLDRDSLKQQFEL